MAIQFESPKYSLMVMTTIVFSLVGAFGFLFLADSPISMVSMLGFLMMVGNVVNGGILYVETATQLRAEMPLEGALVEGGSDPSAADLNDRRHHCNLGGPPTCWPLETRERNDAGRRPGKRRRPSGVHGPDASDASHLLPVRDQDRTAVCGK